MDTWQHRARAAMKEKNLTQKDIADALCISQPAFYAWLSGRNTPNIENMQQLANIIGVDVAWLCFGVEERRRPLVGKVTDIIGQMPDGEVEKLLPVVELLQNAIKRQ